MDGTSIKNVEFNAICRLCIQLLESEKVSPIFNNEIYSERVSLPERIRYCSSIEVCEGDGLPNKICSSCLMKLNESFVFRNQCVLADNTLKKLKNVTLNLEEITRFVNVDMENQIIQPEVISSTEKIHNCSVNLKGSRDETTLEAVQSDASIDEFDNSKNGRHKRNIRRSQGRCIQRLKICKNGIENLNDVNMEFFDESLVETNVESALGETSKQNKIDQFKYAKKWGPKRGENSENEFWGHEALIKSRRGRKSKGKKSGEVEMEIKAEIKQEIVENFTVEPDVFGFEDTRKETNEGIEKGEKRQENNRTHRKIVKDKCAVKRGRPRKYSIVKEKPSSYTCDYCQKVYPSEGGWRYHIHTIHNENYQPFICDLCGKAFKVKKNLEGHKNSIHYHLKHHLCDICGRGFASKYALKVHKIWHSDEKNFPCDICGTKFRTRGKMNTHRSIHGGPKKFMCHVCSRDFRWKKDFEIHMRTHTGEKPFKCSHCGKAFSSLTNMKKHERNHVGKVKISCGLETYDGQGCDVPSRENFLYKTELPYHYNSASEITNRDPN